MNNRALTLSLLMGVLAVFFVQSYVNSIEDAEKKRFGTEVLVLKAKRDIKEMETINETMIEFQSIPKRFVEPAGISYEKQKDDKDIAETTARAKQSLVGSIATVPIKKGEQVTYNKVSEPSMRTGLAPQITPGHRAFSVPVSEVSGVSKLVKPGDRVDVVAVLDLGGGKDQKIAKTILQDVVVLSVGHNVTNNIARLVETDQFSGRERIKPLAEDSNFTTVSLEVEPAQAQSLALVVANGDAALSLSLRNNDDTDRVTSASTIMTDVLGPDAGRVQRGPSGRK